MLLPIGLDHARVSRLPWVTITLLALNVLAFVGSALATDDAALAARWQELATYWQAHPWLEPPAALRPLLARPDEVDEPGEAEAAVAPRRPAPPEGADLEPQRRELAGLAEAYLAEREEQPRRRFALVAARGAWQVGWLTHLFVHADLEHLLGNMLLFLLVVAPFLEDVWGGGFFLAFYLGGGLVAALAQVLPQGASQVGLIGASGAISACLGAFAVRFAHRKVRVFYWFFLLLRGTFFVPAWAYALAFAAMNLWALSMTGTTGPVAFAAHLGGFAFGLGVVLVMRATRLEDRLSPEGATRWRGDMGHDRAAEALAAGDVAGARQRLQEVVQRRPDDEAALLELARMDAARLDAVEATPRVERLVLLRLAAGDEAGARALAAELGQVTRPDLLRPASAYRLAELVEPAEPERAARLFQAAACGDGALVGKAALRAALLLRATRPAEALELAELAAASSEAPPPLAAQARALAAELAAGLARADPFAGGLAPEPEAPEAGALGPAEPVRLVRCRLAGADEGGLDLVTAEGRRARVEAARLAAVACGLVPGKAAPGATAPPRPTVLVDLLLHPRPGEPRVVLRLPGHGLDLARLAPGVPPAEAFARLLGRLLDASGARAIPDRGGVQGQAFARFADAAAFERAAWGRRLEPPAR